MVKFGGNHHHAVAVVTGGGDGMGLQLALRLARAGCDVAMCDIDRAKLRAAEVKVAAAAAGGAVVSAHECDLSVAEEVHDLPRAVAAAHPGLSGRTLLLFNNAGIAGGMSLVTDPKEAFDKVLRVDLHGVLACTRAFLPLLLAAPAAHVVNTSSVCGLYANLGYLRPNVAYTTAKFAVRGFTLALLEDFKPNAPHIKATCVCPGWIGTGIVETSTNMLAADLLGEIRKGSARVRARIAALKREGDPATLKLEKLGLLESQMTDLSQVSDEQLKNLSMMLGPGFRHTALTSAEDAADIILKGVADDDIEVLVGPDAHGIAELIRRDERALYEDGSIVPAFFEYDNWEMNRESKL